MRIAVIGQGFVGGSLATVFSERGFVVYTHDKTGKISNGSFELSSGWSLGEMVDYAESAGKSKGQDFTGVYFVCVPTPMQEDGSADLSIVESVLEELANFPGERIAVIKSTVPPGSTDLWNKRYNGKGLYVVFNPEFLTEVNAIRDMRNQNRIILGGSQPSISVVKSVFQRAFPEIPIIETESTTAEMVKYVTNCFLSVKVSFANEMLQICESLKTSGLIVDYDKVIEFAKMDKRLGETHWSVPGPVPTDDGRYVRGFGGHCFPKDINALMSVARSFGIKPAVMQAAWDKNLEVRGPDDRDWEKQVGRAVSKRKI